MSSNLYWEPKERKRNALSIEIKAALRKHWGGCGDLTGSELERRDLDYLKGLRDAGIDGLDNLIAGIERYGAVELVEEF